MHDSKLKEGFRIHSIWTDFRIFTAEPKDMAVNGLKLDKRNAIAPRLEQGKKTRYVTFGLRPWCRAPDQGRRPAERLGINNRASTQSIPMNAYIRSKKRKKEKGACLLLISQAAQKLLST